MPREKPTPAEDEEEEIRPRRQPTQRDEVQLLVRDNPEAAALVLRKWIQSKS